MLTVLLWHWKHTTSCHHYPDIRLILRQTGWITSRNQDCQEKYQQLQVCRWYHSSGRKWRRTKEPLNEGESRKWKKLAWNSTIKKLRPCNSVPSLQVKGEKVEAMTEFLFSGSKITADGDCSHEIKRRLLLGRKAVTNVDKRIKKQRHHFADEGPYSQSYGFSSSHVRMWELDHTEGRAPKKWCFWNVVLETTLKESLGLQGDQTNQS